MGDSTARARPSSPFDHLPAGRWARTSAEGVNPGDLLALRLPAAAQTTTTPDVWIWRLTPADIVRCTDSYASIQVYGLGPAFLTRAGNRSTPEPGPEEISGPSPKSVWELWKFYPDGDGDDPSAIPAERRDQLAERRANRSRRSPRDPDRRIAGPYHEPVYRVLPPQVFPDFEL